MAKGKKSNKKPDNEPRIANRKAYFNYHISDQLECGIKLRGSEVKSLRNGQANISEGFARVEPKTDELILYNVEIAPYPQAGEFNNHRPRRERKLLAHRRQIAQLAGASSDKGVTIVPLAMYFKGGKVKVEIGLARGKKDYDKRQSLKQKDADRQIRRAMTRKVV